MHTVIITPLSPFALIENVVSGEALCNGKFMAHKDSPGSRRSMAALSADLQYSQNRLPLAGIFTILWRDLITLSLYCVRARAVTRGLFSDAQADSRWAPLCLSAVRYDGALYWSTNVHRAREDRLMAIDLHYANWLALESSCLFARRAYTCIHRRHRATYTRGQGDSPDPTWKVLLFYDNVLHWHGSAEAKWRQKNVSKSLL